MKSVIQRALASSAVSDAVEAARLAARIPGLLRRRIDLPIAEQYVRTRLENRSLLFCQLLDQAVFQNRRSPYRELLRVAGCEQGDLERLVRLDGVEGALATIFARGVYLTEAEFKGWTPAQRGSATIFVNPGSLRTRVKAARLPIATGGSRGRRTPVPLDLETFYRHSLDFAVHMHHGGSTVRRHAQWGVPGSASMSVSLRYHIVGCHLEHWFSQVDVNDQQLHPRYRWSNRLIRWAGYAAGVRLPRPEFVSLEHPEPIARWMERVLQSGDAPQLHTHPSGAVRVCTAAAREGIDLHGAVFHLGGEPFTEARARVIRDMGAQAIVRYSAADSGLLGFSCPRGEAPDDVHVCADLHAVIQPRERGDELGVPPDTLFWTSVDPEDGTMLLNTSIGDRAILDHRKCGCALEDVGWTVHLRDIGAYSKVTAGGMTFMDTELLRVLEEVLPARFGGGATDYQLEEVDDENGGATLILRVHPLVGQVDEPRLINAFIDAVGGGSGVERVMALQWRSSELVRIVREPPKSTASGKILHLRSARGEPATAA